MFLNTKYNLLQKLFSLLFAFLVFGTVLVLGSRKYIDIDLHYLSYMGIMLLITVVYLELMIIRDHLWILEGSIKEARRWREVFFTKHSLKQLRLRKLVVVIAATLLFTVVYIFNKDAQLYSFLGIILMVTVLYFEVLSIRDELHSLSFDLKARQIEEMVRVEKDSDSLQPIPDNDEGGLAPKDDEA